MLLIKKNVCISLPPNYRQLPEKLLLDHPGGVTKEQVYTYLLLKSIPDHHVFLIQNGLTFEPNGQSRSLERIDLMIHVGDVYENNRVRSEYECVFMPEIPISWVTKLDIGKNLVGGLTINIRPENLMFENYTDPFKKTGAFDLAYGLSSEEALEINVSPRRYLIVLSDHLHRLTSQNPTNFGNHSEFYNKSLEYRSDRVFATKFCSTPRENIIVCPKVSLRYFLYLSKISQMRYFNQNSQQSPLYRYYDSISHG